MNGRRIGQIALKLVVGALKQKHAQKASRNNTTDKNVKETHKLYRHVTWMPVMMGQLIVFGEIGLNHGRPAMKHVAIPGDKLKPGPRFKKLMVGLIVLEKTLNIKIVTGTTAQ